MKPETQTSLKQAIRKLTYSSQVKPEVVETIVEELKKGEITQQEWETLFNQEGADIAIENKVHTPNFIRLLTLRSLIIPETLTEYQKWLDIRKNKKPEENQTVTLNFQQALSSVFPQQQAALGIIHLLTKLQNKKISVDEIYWLLSNNENKNIWAKSKKEFINIIKHDLELIENHNNKLIKTEFNEDSLIIKTGIWKTLIQKWEEIKKGNYQSQEYKKLAKLMEKLEESDLSAYFYQVSDGTVEKNLFYEVNPAFNVSLEIFGIPIKKRENWIDVSTRIIEEKLGIVSKETKKIEHYRKLYRELDRLLQAQNFKEADLETERIMLAVTKRKKEGWLRIEDAEKFPYKELRSIDKLWLKYSGGKFGISVQQKIYQSLGGTKKYNRDVWESIGDRLGWRRGGNWLDYSDYNFSQTAPSGHLPKAGMVHLQIERYAKLERLKNLLQAQNFKEADRETREIILVVANREKEGWLRVKDAEKFPCKELLSIDKLWLKHSGGKFGISVQQQIYQSLGGTKKYNHDVWMSMGYLVGWRYLGLPGWEWLSYSDYNFTQTAQSGHLPCVLSVGRDWRRWQFRWLTALLVVLLLLVLYFGGFRGLVWSWFLAFLYLFGSFFGWVLKGLVWFLGMVFGFLVWFLGMVFGFFGGFLGFCLVFGFLWVVNGVFLWVVGWLEELWLVVWLWWKVEVKEDWWWGIGSWLLEWDVCFWVWDSGGRMERVIVRFVPSSRSTVAQTLLSRHAECNT